jgi:raffinose/stachyose/melibiose transport system permease protein
MINPTHLARSQPAVIKRPSRLRAGLPYIRWYTGLLYMLPALVVFIVFALLPMADTLRMSFYKWDGINPAVFSGLSNYTRMVTNPDFLTSLEHNFYFIIFNSILPILIGLAVTALLTRRDLPGMAFFRVTFFLPQVIPLTVIGVAWMWMLNPAFGPINQFLKLVGLSSLARPWLGDFDLARPIVGLMTTWMTFGLCMVLFIAGTQHINAELYDAAEMDGANEFRQFLVVTLPGLRNEIGVALVTTLIGAMRLFGLIYVTTRGGPGKETQVIAYQLYQAAFIERSVGYSAAIAVALTTLIMAISLGALWLQRQMMQE